MYSISHQNVEQTLWTKASKISQQYFPLRTTSKLLLFLNYKYLTNRYLSIQHARIRKNCSNLNNLRDNPLCSWCNEIEDSEHYVFHCNNYRDERYLFFEAVRDVQPLTTQLLLYGNKMVDKTLNSTLFRAVHDYIKST